MLGVTSGLFLDDADVPVDDDGSVGRRGLNVTFRSVVASRAVTDLDLDAKAATVIGKGGIARQVNWYTHTAHLLARLTSGRSSGPVFLSERRPRTPVASADRDPVSGHARLSYRRAAECLTAGLGEALPGHHVDVDRLGVTAGTAHGHPHTAEGLTCLGGGELGVLGEAPDDLDGSSGISPLR